MILKMVEGCHDNSLDTLNDAGLVAASRYRLAVTTPVLTIKYIGTGMPVPFCQNHFEGG